MRKSEIRLKLDKLTGKDDASLEYNLSPRIPTEQDCIRVGRKALHKWLGQKTSQAPATITPVEGKTQKMPVATKGEDGGRGHA